MTENPEQRSATMRRVKSEDTGPEWRIRRLLTRLGYRYRLHRKDLPGKPDIVFPGRKKLIFIHGCFWHGHDCPRGARQPKTNADYWNQKIARNRARDIRHLEDIRTLGWSALVIWECEMKDDGELVGRLRGFLEG